MRGTNDAIPPSKGPPAGRAQPAKARPGGVTADTFSSFVRNLSKLEGGRPQAGKGGEGGR